MKDWIAFPLFFVAVWLGVTTFLGLASGWYGLMRTFQDRPDDRKPPKLRLRFQSGSVGMVSMRGILNLAVHEEGLRVAIVRVFGPFCRPVLVPWRDIAVAPRRGIFGPAVALRLGERATLTLAADIAVRLARAAGPLWPEPETIPAGLGGNLARRLFKEWALTTAAAATFFTLVPLFVMPAHARPPILIGILFPAVVFGLGAFIQFWLQRER